MFLDEDIKTVKELMGATIDDIPLDKRLADINLTTDDETHSELKLTDVEQSIAQVSFHFSSINLNVF